MIYTVYRVRSDENVPANSIVLEPWKRPGTRSKTPPYGNSRRAASGVLLLVLHACWLLHESLHMKSSFAFRKPAYAARTEGLYV